MKKTLYRTVIELEILSESPIDEGHNLDHIIDECTDGDYSGHWEYKKLNKEIIGKKAVEFCEKHGTDCDFFQMDTDGFEVE